MAATLQPGVRLTDMARAIGALYAAVGDAAQDELREMVDGARAQMSDAWPYGAGPKRRG